MFELKPFSKSDPIYEDYESILEQKELIYNFHILEYYNENAFKFFLIGVLGFIIGGALLFGLIINVLHFFIIFIVPLILVISLYLTIKGYGFYILAKRTQKTPYKYILTNERLMIEEYNDEITILLENIKIIEQFKDSETYSISIEMKKPAIRFHQPRRFSSIYIIPFISNTNNLYEKLCALTSKKSEILTSENKSNKYSLLKFMIFIVILLDIVVLIVGVLGLFNS